MPTLIVWGREDRFVPLAHAQAYREGIAGAELRCSTPATRPGWKRPTPTQSG